MRRFGCLAVLFVIALLSVEFYVLLLVMDWMKDILGPIIILIVLSVIGVKIMQFHLKRLGPSFVTGQIGGRIIGLIGGLLVVIPGFITTIIGLLMQIPLVQKMFSRIGMMLAASIMKRALGGGFGKSFSGGFPGGGFPGGFPGGGFPGGALPPGGFPGLKPDERLPLGKPTLGKSKPKTYDVQPDKD